MLFLTDKIEIDIGTYTLLDVSSENTKQKFK